MMVPSERVMCASRYHFPIIPLYYWLLRHFFFHCSFYRGVSTTSQQDARVVCTYSRYFFFLFFPTRWESVKRLSTISLLPLFPLFLYSWDVIRWYDTVTFPFFLRERNLSAGAQRKGGKLFPSRQTGEEKSSHYRNRLHSCAPKI